MCDGKTLQLMLASKQRKNRQQSHSKCGPDFDPPLERLSTKGTWGITEDFERGWTTKITFFPQT